MTDSDAGQEQTYSSDDGGLRQAASELSEKREAAAAAEASSPHVPPNALDEAGQREAKEQTRKFGRMQLLRALEDNLERDGRKLDARSASEMLAGIRKMEALQDAQDAEQAQAAATAELPNQAPTAEAQPAAPVQEHPQVKEALARASAYEAQQRAGLAQLYEVTRAVAARDFNDIRTIEDVQNLAATDPVRFAQFEQAANVLEATSNQIKAFVEHDRVQSQQKFATYARAQDDAFTDRHPELREPAKAAEAAMNAIEALKPYGLTEQEIISQFQTNPLMRDARVQSMLYELGKQHAARGSIRSRRVAPIPQFVRPGTARDRGTDTGELESLARQYGRGELTPKQAGEWLAAKRRARAR